MAAAHPILKVARVWAPGCRVSIFTAPLHGFQVSASNFATERQSPPFSPEAPHPTLLFRGCACAPQADSLTLPPTQHYGSYLSCFAPHTTHSFLYLQAS